jgi:ferric-dicitrate binding protein FerR (iron transport regulator)
MTGREDNEDRFEADLAGLLQEAGRRDAPPESVGREIRAAVHAEWQGIVRARRQRRVWLGAAAAAVVAACALWLALPLREQTAAVVATLERMTGPTMHSSGSQWRPTVQGEPIRVGDRLRTDGAGRLALRIDTQTTVRLDENTLAVVTDADTLTLERGAAYIDAAPNTQTTPSLRIDTALGMVRHIGTQYEVRVAGNALRVSVREGKVELQDGAGLTLATAGERLTLDAPGRVQRSAVAPDAASWNWISTVTPSFAIEGRPLIEFLTWAGRELGQEVVFADARTESEVRDVTLRGSIDGLAPETALRAVLSTTRLRHAQRDGRLLIELPQD